MEKINIAIVDDDYLIVTLLKNFFDQRDNLNVVFDSIDGYQLYKHLEDPKNVEELDVLLLDLKMETVGGLDVLEHVKSVKPDLKVVVVSSHYQDNSMGFMLKKGVAAFLPKGISPFDLLDIIDTVNKKGFYFSLPQLDIIREQISTKSPQPVIDEDLELTEREIQIVRLICQQKTAKEIGEMLFITQRTVEGHKNNLFLKIGVKNIVGLVVFALQKKIISLPELSL
nr:response regulator transcription factor [uncultured Flavobacterium sp.]